MDFTVFKDRLVAEGYTDDTAYAKIAHDIVLKAVRDSGFHDNLTVKGGVVMSSLTLKSSVESLTQRYREAESAEKVQMFDGKENHDKQDLGKFLLNA